VETYLLLFCMLRAQYRNILFTFTSSSTKMAQISTDADLAKAKSAYDFIVADAKHEPFDLAQRRGKVTLIANVASKCGLTKDGYQAYTTLYDRYKDRGFTVLAFPCNGFASQEPGTESEICAFAAKEFRVEFPIMAKIDVNGDHASPLWKYLKKEKPGIFGTEGIKWNFTSFLVDSQGKVVTRYSPGEKADVIEKDLLPLLK
jgi:glutathione peroxidase-type tryparedoxin peroxidase